MLKKSAFILLLMLFCGNSFSQTSVYKPFPTLYGRWVLRIDGPYSYMGGSAGVSWKRYEANGDTTINSITYKKVYVANNIGYPIGPGGPPFGPSTFGFAYRNDIPAKKVYIFTKINGQDKDTLWYDFNLQVGDTLKSNYSIAVNPNDPDNERIIVTTIDSVLICNTYYKRFNFNCSGFIDLGLIEGFGFEDNFIQTGYPFCPFEPVYIYHTDFSCSLSSINEQTNSIQQLQLFPNPTNNALQINYSKQNIVLPIEYSIVDCLGKVVLNGTVETNKNINVSKLPTGLYFITMQDKQNNLFQGKFVKE